MTQVTPPGWYPDPGQTNDGPPTERWWDGKAWTDRTRPAGTGAPWGPPTQPPAAGDAQQPHPTAPTAPLAHGAQPGYPAYPGYPAPAQAGSRRGLRTGIAVAVATAVLACIGVGVYLLAKGDGGGNADQAGSRQGAAGGQNGGVDGGFGQGGSGGPGGSGGSQGSGGAGGFGGPGGSGGASPSPDPSEAPKVKGGGTVPDTVNGISLTVPKGWTGRTISVGAQVTSDDSYKCPGNSAQTCTSGGAYTAPAEALGIDGDTPEAVAKADIAANAKESYGGTTYGSITSHQELGSGAVTVAGQKGYMVRWKAVTSKGADGYVESVAFPSPDDTKQIVVVRFGIDVGQQTSVIDDILKGIKVSSGSGNGQDI
ncbi:DUF2510 domain-containing protein [Streptomyces roseochromogenus]|uniref:DUF2510 domain-containing protein n=1 Tax=Streptomyces roseochromogenus subsp. oscitans DS 12.976 TaxID=1352936 RepID=V6KTC1_STRRC|nr:DUF2510 domain-containing protein [Streptomyces roseochromogenus]EST35258.1 hypothetical protein M878_06845 [Streptomyces roseochromogenus subsp. oscitans DS 12.976]